MSASDDVSTRLSSLEQTLNKLVSQVQTLNELVSQLQSYNQSKARKTKSVQAVVPNLMSNDTNGVVPVSGMVTSESKVTTPSVNIFFKLNYANYSDQTPPELWAAATTNASAMKSYATSDEKTKHSSVVNKLWSAMRKMLDSPDTPKDLKDRLTAYHDRIKADLEKEKAKNVAQATVTESTTNSVTNSATDELPTE